MLKLNDAMLETVSGGNGKKSTSYTNSFNTNININKNTALVAVDNNLVFGGAILVSISQTN